MISRAMKSHIHWTKKRIYSCLQTEQIFSKFGALNLNQICTRCKENANTNVHTCGVYVQIRSKDDICSKFTSSLLLRQMCNFYTHLLKTYLCFNSCSLLRMQTWANTVEIYLFALIFHPICLESNKRVNAKFTLIYHRGKLGSLCDSVWLGLAYTCDDLRSLWSRSNLHASRSKFFTVWPPNPSRCKLSDAH